MPQSRFNRDYKLVVQVSGGQSVEVVPPMRVSFSANKSVSGGLNKLTLNIYNLKTSNRLALVKDAEQRKHIPLSFSAGYNGELKLLFKGTVHRGTNSREGADFVTELECLDGGFDVLNSFTSKTVKGKARAVDSILGDMPNTSKGKLTTQQDLIRPKILVGSSAKLIDELVGDGETWYIDDEKLYIIKDDEVVSSFIPVVKASTGLLNTPSREQSKATFDTLMNPTLKIGGLCKLESVNAPHINGVYKIDSMGYTGDNYGAKWSQSVTGILTSGYKTL